MAATEPGPIVECDAFGNWRSGRYVGELHRDGRVLDIQHRLGIEAIAHWASAALNIRMLPRSGTHASSDALIMEFLAALWRSALKEASRHGLPGLRTPLTHTSAVVRGRLDVPGTLKLRAVGRPLVSSVSRPKNVHNPVTQAIVAADRVLDSGIARRDWRGDRIDELLPRLRGAAGSRPKLPTKRELAAVRYTPITLPYKRVADLSYQIAKRRGLQSHGNGGSGSGLLIDVAELWELFVLHCAKRAFGASNVTHGTALSEGGGLLRSAHSPNSVLGRLYPDIIVGPTAKPWAIIDAKYKPLKDPRGVDRDDLYQLSSYLASHSENPLPMGALAYVRFPGQERVAYAESRGPWVTARGHTAMFTRLPITEDECVAALRTLLPSHASFTSHYGADFS